MNVAQLKRFCRALPGTVEVDSGAPYNWLVYSVRGRKYAYFKTSEPERWRFSVRVSRDRFVELTEFPGVKPARYRGRYGWITIVNVAALVAEEPAAASTPAAPALAPTEAPVTASNPASISTP